MLTMTKDVTTKYLLEFIQNNANSSIFNTVRNNFNINTRGNQILIHFVLNIFLQIP